MPDHDLIEAVGINEAGSLWVKPATATLPYIYREAAEVHWDVSHRYLYSPRPRDWSYGQWYRHIIDIAASQGVHLRPSTATRWVNIDPVLQQEIQDSSL
jgi:hypothetical protein